MKNIVVSDILYKLTGNKKVYDENVDLIEEKILDSATFIELFAELEDLGVTLYPTRIPKEALRNVKLLQKEVDNYLQISV